MNDELPDRLRRGAEEFEPDQGRMWARVSDGMREVRSERAATARTRWRAPLAAMATGAAVVLIGGIVLLGQAIGIGPVIHPTPDPPAAGDDTPGEGPPPSTGGDEGTASSTSEPDDGTTADSSTGSTSGEPVETGGETSGAVDWLVAGASIDPNSSQYWTQVNLVLENEVQLTAATVELRVALSEDMANTGAFSTNNTRFNDAVVTEEDGFLVYRWTLRAGQELPAGDYQFGAQFEHPTARDAAADTYAIVVAGANGEDAEVEGGLV